MVKTLLDHKHNCAIDNVAMGPMLVIANAVLPTTACQPII